MGKEGKSEEAPQADKYMCDSREGPSTGDDDMLASAVLRDNDTATGCST